jgi:DnaJ-class molecular chaperone
MKHHDLCESCSGKGWIELRCVKLDEAIACQLCNGSGTTTAGRDCSGCQGTGLIELRTVEQQKCNRCDGTGRYPPPEAM